MSSHNRDECIIPNIDERIAKGLVFLQLQVMQGLENQSDWGAVWFLMGEPTCQIPVMWK